MPVEIDEEILKNIAANTGAKYFRATNTEKLAEIYKEIGELEKTKIEVKEFTRYEEYFGYFLSAGLLLFILEIVFAQTVFRKIP
jgi:Ca-activated chloride channel family protein